MLEDIGVLCMERLQKMREKHEKWNDGIYPNIRKKLEIKKKRSLDYNNLFLGEYKCSSLAFDREERRDEKKRLDHLKQDQTMLVIKRFSERNKVFRERKKTEKIRAKSLFPVKKDDHQKEIDDAKTPLDVCSPRFGAPRDQISEIIATKTTEDGSRLMVVKVVHGFLEKFEGGFEQDIDDEGEEDKENEKMMVKCESSVI
ncbi:hypothetical protein Tco_0720764 [Tanacetum coccineum]